MMSDLMREEFELLMVSEGKSVKRCQDSYHFGTVHRKWLFWQRAWQGSREALVIELPHEVTHVTCIPYEEGRDDVIAAIHAAGVKTK